MWTEGENVTISLCFQLQTNPCNPGTSVARRGGGAVRQLWMWVFLSWNSIDLFKSPSEKNTQVDNNMSIPAQRSPKSERGLVSEAQHRIASAPITLIKKGTLPPGALPYWAVSDVPFFRVSFRVKKFAKKS